MVLSALILLLPAQLALHLWPQWSFIAGLPVDYLSPALYLTDLIIFTLIFSSRTPPRLPLPLIIFAVFNIAVSLSPVISLFRWIRVIEFFWLFRYLVSRSGCFLNAVSHWLPLAVIWTSLLAWLQFFFQSSLGGWLYWLGERPLSPVLPGVAKIQLLDLGLRLRPYSVFPHPNALAGFLLVSALVICHLERGRKIFLISKLAVLVAALTIPVTFSRTAIILEALIITTWLVPQKFNPIGKSLLLLLPPLLSLWVFSLGNPASLSQRLVMIQKSLAVITSRPITGLGLGTFVAAYPRYSVSPSVFHLNTQPVHNLYLLLASEIGLPAAVAILFSVIVFLKKLVSVSLPLTAAVASVLATGSLDHYWLTSHQNLLLLTILIAVIALESKRKWI